MSALACDLYALTMMQAYLAAGMTGPASFELFVRKLPPGRNFLLAAGLEQAVEALEGLRATRADIAWVRRAGLGDAVADYLNDLRFTGDVDAIPEGTPVFADEPLLRVTAPLPVAQLVEARLIAILHYQTLVASKAVRMVLAAGGRRLVDFGMRRAHGLDAADQAARASFIAGFSATATVPAAIRFGIPASGTMAHSFVQAHDDESEAFRAFAEARPEGAVLLLDTYDPIRAAGRVVALAPALAAHGVVIKGVRLDSGDVGAQARTVRAMLDEAGLTGIDIFASGNMDEERIRALADTPIDGFGVGTSLAVPPDAPTLDCVYKLQEYDGRPRRKRSEGKATWPGRKQVYRRDDGAGRMAGDTLTLEGDRQPGRPLLATVMRGGRRLAASPPLAEVRAHALRGFDALPPALRSIDHAFPYDVEVAAPLRELARQVDRRRS